MSLIDEVKNNLRRPQIEKTATGIYARQGNLFFSSLSCADVYAKSTIRLIDSVHAKDPKLAHEIAQQVKDLFSSPTPVIAALIDSRDEKNQCGEIMEQVHEQILKTPGREKSSLSLEERFYGMKKASAYLGAATTRYFYLPPQNLTFFCWDEQRQRTCMPPMTGGTTKAHEEKHAVHNIQDFQAVLVRVRTPDIDFKNLEEKTTHEFSNRIQKALGFEPLTKEDCDSSHPAWKLPSNAPVYLAPRPTGFSSPLSAAVPDNLVEYALHHTQPQQNALGQTALLTVAGIAIAKIAMAIYNRGQARRAPRPGIQR